MNEAMDTVFLLDSHGAFVFPRMGEASAFTYHDPVMVDLPAEYICSPTAVGIIKRSRYYSARDT